MNRRARGPACGAATTVLADIRDGPDGDSSVVSGVLQVRVRVFIVGIVGIVGIIGIVRVVEFVFVLVDVLVGVLVAVLVGVLEVFLVGVDQVLPVGGDPLVGALFDLFGQFLGGLIGLLVPGRSR